MVVDSVSPELWLRDLAQTQALQLGVLMPTSSAENCPQRQVCHRVAVDGPQCLQVTL